MMNRLFGNKKIDHEQTLQKKIADLQFIGRKEELQLLYRTYGNLTVKQEVKEQYYDNQDAGNGDNGDNGNNGDNGDNNRSQEEQQADNLTTASLIHGSSGTGKSTLVFRFLDGLKQKQEQSYFSLIGKYNESENSGPFCAIIAALNNFTASLPENDAKLLRESAINTMGTAEMTVLLAFFPGLTAFFNRRVDSTSGSANTNETDTSLTTSGTSGNPSYKESSDVSYPESYRFSASSGSNLSYRMSSVSYRNTSTSLTSNNTSGGSTLLSYYPDSSKLSALWGSNLTENVTNSLLSSVGGGNSETASSEIEAKTSNVSSSVPQENVWNRLKFIIYTFVNLIMKMNRPVIIFIDDLQWADKESLDFIKSLLTDKSLANLMFIGACRENKDGCIDESIKDLFVNRKASNYITMNNLSFEDTNNFLLEALHLSETIDILSKIVYNRTNGNVFLIKQLLEELINKKVLTFSVSTNRWGLNNFDNTRMNPLDKKIFSVEAKIHSCSEDLRQTLIIASFVGCDFEKYVLQVILDKIGLTRIAKDLHQTLGEGVASGLLLFREDTKKYYFSHDKIYEATTTLLQHKEEERRVLQGKIGVYVYEMYFNKNFPASADRLLLVAANNINAGLTDVDFTKKAKINLSAGRSSLSMASYELADNFFKHGIYALTRIRSHWATEYKLSLLLFRNLVEAKFSLDNEYEGMQYAREIFKQATSITDKLPTFVSLSSFQTRKDNHLQSLNTVLSATKELGDLPQNRYYLHTLKSILYIRRWFNRHSDDDVLKLPLINGGSNHQRLKLLFEGSGRAGYCGKTVEWILFVVYGLRLGLQVGLCGETILFITSCSSASMIMGDHRLAMRFANLGLKAIRSIPANNVTCWTYWAFSTWFFPWSSTERDMLTLSQEGHRLAMEFGALDSAAGNRFSLIGIAFAAGYPLSVMRKSCEETLNHFAIYDIQMGIIQVDEYRLLSYWLTEQLEIDWKDVASFGPNAEVESDLHRCIIGYGLRLVLAVIFGKYDIAETMAKKSKQLTDDAAGLFMHFMDIQRLCFSFLSKAGLAHRTGQMKYRRQALRMAKSLKAYTQPKGDTSRHIELLLDAEVIALGKPIVKKIVHAHKIAVLEALAKGHTQYAALGLELAGEHMLRLGKEKLASNFFSQARDCYLEWGATAKVQQMKVKRVAYLDQPGTEPMIPSLSQNFENNKDAHHPDILSFDFRLLETEKTQLLDRLTLNQKLKEQ